LHVLPVSLCSGVLTDHPPSHHVRRCWHRLLSSYSGVCQTTTPGLSGHVLCSMSQSGISLGPWRPHPLATCAFPLITAAHPLPCTTRLGPHQPPGSPLLSHFCSYLPCGCGRLATLALPLPDSDPCSRSAIASIGTRTFPFACVPLRGFPALTRLSPSLT